MELGTLIGYKIDQLTSPSIQEGPKKSTHQRALTLKEEKTAILNADKGPLTDMKYF